MIIGVNGYGYSGSGAVMDLLKEYDELQVLDGFEFQVIQEPDGLLDLMHCIVDGTSRQGSNVGIQRFLRKHKIKAKVGARITKVQQGDYISLVNTFITQLNPISWKGFSRIEPNDISHNPSNYFTRRLIGLANLIFRIFSIPLVFPRDRTCFFAAMDGDAFENAANAFLVSILKAHGMDLKKKLVLNQPFSILNPYPAMQFLHDSKAIIVDRDPRDIYLLVREHVRRTGRFMPYNDVDSFVRYYKSLHMQFDPRNSDSQVLHLRFEDLVYQYEDTRKKIETFANTSVHGNPMRFFNPAISAANTQLFSIHKNYAKDIAYIEKHLEAWLYPFPGSNAENATRRHNIF